MEKIVFARRSFALAMIGLIGIMTSLLITSKWGVGTSPDSAVYVNAARNLLDGQGLNVLSNLGGIIVRGEGSGPTLTPLTQFPPVFPLLLSSLSILGVDPAVGARWIVALFFGANIVLIGVITNRIRGSVWFSIFGSLLILTSQDMIQIHAFAWSEAPFIFFGFVGLYFLNSYLLMPRTLHLVCSATAVAIALMTRYAGVSLVIAGIMGILCFSEEKYGRRIVRAAFFGFMSCLPIGLWFIRNLLLGQLATNREMHLHPVTYVDLKSGLFYVSSWVIPYRSSTALKLATLGLLVTAFFLINRMMKREENRGCGKNGCFYQKSCMLMELFVFTYLGILIVSSSFFEGAIKFDGRLLSPLYVSLAILVVFKIHRLLLFFKDQKILRGGLVLACAVFLVFNGIRSFISVVGQHQNGAYSYENKFNYNSKLWHESELIEEIRKLSAETSLYTNVPDALYMLAGRSSYKIPPKKDYATKRMNFRYTTELEAMGRRIKDENGLLVYFSAIAVGNLPSEDELRRGLNLMLERRFKDGSIYRGEM